MEVGGSIPRVCLSGTIRDLDRLWRACFLSTGISKGVHLQWSKTYRFGALSNQNCTNFDQENDYYRSPNSSIFSVPRWNLNTTR